MQENVWQLQEGKAKFSALMRAAERYPQIITVHGQKRAVVLSWAVFKRFAAAKENTTEERIEQRTEEMQDRQAKYKARETLQKFIKGDGKAPFSLTISKLVRIKKILCNQL